MTGIVYVFTNPAMPGYVKIGRTSQADVMQRLKELSNPTGVPVPFECLYAAEVADASKVEEAIHKAFDVDRINPKREFFKTDPQRIIILLEAMQISDVTPATEEMLDKIISPEDKEAQDKAIGKPFKKMWHPKKPKDIDEMWGWVQGIAEKQEAATKEKPNKNTSPDYFRIVKECIAERDAQRLYEETKARRQGRLRGIALGILDLQQSTPDTNGEDTSNTDIDGGKLVSELE